MKYKKAKLKDIIFFNPKETIKKNQLAKKIPMDALIPFTRKVGYYEVKEFNSGTKFRNNDTLMARITPCLENGKTAYVNILDEDEIAFGSTEYFVLRADENYILPKYLYYISISDELRNTVIKSMTGTSGRQRAQKESVLDFEIELPSISIQKKVLSILDSIDSKIEINNQIISNLEELASTLFKRWFVDFEFPDENGNPYKSSGGKMVDSELGEIPEGWHIDIISNLMENFDRKRVPLSKMQREKRKGEYPYYGATSLMDYVDDFLFDGIHLLLGEDGTVITKEGNPVLQYVWGKFWVNNHAHVLKGRGYVSTEWLYLWFKQTNVSGIVTGAVQPKISQTNLNRLKVVFPDKELLIKFQKNIGIMFDKLVVISNEMTTLTELRDTLLPRLLSGEIELSEDGEV